jgi:hypothetical protein
LPSLSGKLILTWAIPKSIEKRTAVPRMVVAPAGTSPPCCHTIRQGDPPRPRPSQPPHRRTPQPTNPGECHGAPKTRPQTFRRSSQSCCVARARNILAQDLRRSNPQLLVFLLPGPLLAIPQTA